MNRTILAWTFGITFIRSALDWAPNLAYNFGRGVGAFFSSWLVVWLVYTGVTTKGYGTLALGTILAALMVFGMVESVVGNMDFICGE